MANNPRLKDFIKNIDVNDLSSVESSFVLFGYPDDEGIYNNGGRIGAKDGPQAIRNVLLKMTKSFLHSQSKPIYDLSDMNLEGDDIAERHEKAKEIATKVLSAGHQLIGLGGGHDYGYVDGSAFLDTYKNSKPIVINIDAHLDVRSTENGINSGTPFYRLLNEQSEFEFFQVGIQSQCNSQEHFNWCQAKNVRILTWDEIRMSGDLVSTAVLNFLGESLLKPRPCFLSIDIDAFSSAYAMGCSQSWPSGFDPDNFFRLLNVLKSRLDIKALGIYEVSPPLDLDNRTAKLAAQIIHQFIFG